MVSLAVQKVLGLISLYLFIFAFIYFTLGYWFNKKYCYNLYECSAYVLF